MTNKAEREKIVGRGSAVAKHSLNQYTTKTLREYEEKGVDRKAAGAAKKRRRQEQFEQNLPKAQFDRALGHILEGRATPEDINYALKNIGRYEKRVGRFSTGETRIIATVVDFTRRDQL